MTEAHNATDRHASWLELFFDLVVVVAVNQLAHLLHGDAHHGPGGLHIVTFFTHYLAIWLVWTTFTLYSNVLADKVHRRAMFLGMAGIAIMAAAVPQGLVDRSTVFAVAYLVTSAIGSNSFAQSGKVVLTWRAASRNFGLAPWIASFWVANPWVKLSLWLLGLAMTLSVSMLASRASGDELLSRLNERRARQRRRVLPEIEVAQVDAAHLGERLGLFVIIVLGEAMLQLVGAVAGIESWWPSPGHGWLLLLTVTAGFGLLITLWWLNVRYGFAEESQVPTALVLPAHFVAIAAITTVAAGFGSAATASAEHMATSSAWLMCAGISAFLLVITALVGQLRRWPVSLAVVLLPLGTAALSPLLPAAVVVAILLGIVGVQVWNLRTSERGTSS